MPSAASTLAAPRPANARQPPDPARLRVWRQQLLLGFLALSGAALVMALIGLLGHADMEAALAVGGLTMLPPVAAWLAIERGWSWHLGDPTLTAPQLAYTIACAAACYAIAGPLKMAALTIVYLAIVFASVALPAGAVKALAVYALGLFGAVMLAMAHWQPQQHPLPEAGVILLQFLIGVAPVAVITARMSELRARLGRQKAELQSALARINDLAMRDELTGLFNRRRMGDELRRAQAAAEAEAASTCCVALIDLDHFKQVNDRHGHAVGDEVLRSFARIVHAAVLGGDRIGRWGGEEFIVVFATGEIEEAAAGARRILETTAASPLALPRGGELRFTVSIGLAAHRPGTPIEHAVERADRALYEAKQQGRNRIALERA